MKKILMQFADNLLSKEQMKTLKGGTDSYGGIYSGGGGTCGAKCYWGNYAADSQWNLSKTDAISAATQCAQSGGRGYWCCASC